LPPNTQGFTALQIINLIEGYDLTAWGDGTTDYYHHMAEAVKVAFADREEWLTDPRFVNIPLQQLITKAYADERRGLIDPLHTQNIAEVSAGIAYEHPHERRVPDGDEAGGQPVNLLLGKAMALADLFEGICSPRPSERVAGSFG
jgi:gamma-glutamyltranspeptidase